MRVYQNAAYAAEYEAFVRRVEQRRPELAPVVAKCLYKLMAYKDEYEVARLLTKPELEERIRGIWEQPEALEYNLHPPLLRALGWKKKIRFGSWFRAPLRLLASMKGLRGTPLDPFGYARVRQEERALTSWYKDLVEELFAVEDAQATLEIAALPDQIRGYEKIKLDSIVKLKALAAEKIKLASTRAPAGPAESAFPVAR